MAVSIHAPTRGATFDLPRMAVSSSSFNPRAHEGRDRFCGAYIYGLYKFQSTRPRGARLLVCWDVEKLVYVSIHAPTRGATFGGVERAEGLFAVSIHAPTRGATYRALPTWAEEIVSIHAPTRGATIFLQKNAKELAVSIHAPTRGATSDELLRRVIVVVSIHAPTRGATRSEPVAVLYCS